MNNKQWIISKIETDLAGYPCVIHKLTKEKCIAGNNGEIWENNSSSLKCSVIGKHYIKKVANLLGQSVPVVSQGDEAIFTFNINNLATIIKIIQAPRSALLQQGILERR